VSLLLQLLTFVILFLILKQFAFKKITQVLEERRQAIDDGIRLGRDMEAEKAALDEQVGKALQAARADADRIIAEAHEEAGEILKSAEDTASRKTEAMLADAEAHIDQAVRQAEGRLRQEMLDLVSEATEVIIGEKLDAQKDARLIERALGGVRR
jgi:F-type H+-transporting ATPase subunit b